MQRQNILTCFVLSFVFLITCLFSNAQNSGSSISGFVYGDSSMVIPSATISVKNTNTGFVTNTITDAKGYFMLSNLPVGTYDITVSSVGYQPATFPQNTLNLGDRLVLHKIALSRNEGTLTNITVVSNSFKNSINRLGTATAISSRAMQKIPLPTRNYTDLTSLSPLASGASLAGAKSGGTGYMLDGVSNRRATFGGVTDAAFSISSETIREFEVSTNDYDVTNGRGSGGVVKAITKSGTNTLAGSVWGYYGANGLAAKKDINGKTLNSKYKMNQFGALLSGPIIKDKLFFLVAYDQYTNTIPFSSFDFNTAGATQDQAEKNLGITKANMDKVVSIMQQKFGFPVGQEYGTINIKQTTQNVFAKFDYNLNSRNLLTLKYNYLHFTDPNKLKGSGLLSTQYTGVEVDHSLMLGLRTELSSTSYNDLKVNYSTYRKFLSFLHNRVPEGFVMVHSVFSDNSTADKQIAFGNQNWVPETDASNVLQITDNYYFKKGNIDFVVGTDNSYNHITDNLTHDQQGQFYYNSLDDMDANNPYRFNRKIPLDGNNPPVSVPLFQFGVYMQMQMNLRPNLNFTAGLRWDGTLIANKPVYNAQLDKDLGIRTDVVPFDAKNFQPRVNLIWDIHNNGRDIVKVGAGLFASEFTTQPLTFAHIDNGVMYRQVDIYKAQNPTIFPAAEWSTYQSDFSKVPGVDFYNSLPTGAKQPATVLALDKNLKNPLTFKANISFYHYFNEWLRAGINGYFNNTWDNYYLYDLNMKRNPEFVTNEGRDVYVPASTLINGSGKYVQPILANSRVSSNFNQVRYFTNADWASKYFGVMVEAAAKIGKDGSFSLSYAKGKATGTLPYDNGDPRNANFSVANSYWNYNSYGRNWYSDGDQPNKLVALLLSPTFYGFSISSSFQLYQNSRYSSYVNNDIIGTGNNGTNLAYVFDPNDPKTPADIKAGMETLLEKTSPEFRKFLEKNFGKYAPYNGGLQPWRYLWNMSIAKEFRIYKTHKIGLRADIFNVLNLLNHEWGGYSQITNTNLYFVNGFDPATNSFKYTVNQNAGAKVKTANPYYSVQFGVKYSF